MTGVRARKIPALACRSCSCLINWGFVAETRSERWWPPVWVGPYWTAALQSRALRGGARLRRAIGREDNAVGYDAGADMILQYMPVGGRRLSMVSSSRICYLVVT